MPAMTFHGGKLRILYYDLREDVSQLFGPVHRRSCRFSTARSAHPPHDGRVRGAGAARAARPTFTTARVSEYASGFLPGSTVEQRLQFNPPNLPLFRQGAVPFMGDYIDLAPAPPFVLNDNGTWSFNTGASGSAVSHAVWTDNRDVRPPADGNWANYTPVTSPAPRHREPLRSDPAGARRACPARSGCATRTSTRRASPTGCSCRRRATTSSSTAFSAPSSSSPRTRRRCRAPTGCASRTSRSAARRRSCSSARR